MARPEAVEPPTREPDVRHRRAHRDVAADLRDSMSVKAEVQAAHHIVVHRLCSKYGTLATAYKMADKDRLGTISRKEFASLLERLNLRSLRDSTTSKLFELIDCEKTGHFGFPEFVRAMNAHDIYNAGKVRRRAEVKVQEDDTRKMQEQIAARAGMTVEEYCEYFGIPHILV